MTVAAVPVHRTAFRAMGVDVEVLLDGEVEDPADQVDRARAEIARLEGLFSRFRPDSDLGRLNREGAIHASPELLEVTEAALAARTATRGRFDPTVHDALVGAGYDRTFDAVTAHGPGAPSTARCGGAVHVDRSRGVIELEPGVRLDLGGIAKGYVVDRACELLAATGPCLVNAGGDLAVRGALGGAPWPVGVETPGGGLTLALASGAIATSGRDHRRWRRAGVELHHLIDPSTARPSESDLLRVTVVATTAMEAEVLAKSLFLAGEEPAAREADEAGVPCVLVTRDGRSRLCGGLG